METSSKLDLVENLPVYSLSPKGWTQEKKKKVVIISVVVVVLSLIAVAAILIGVKMTQDHTEKIFQMSFTSQDGSTYQQTATVNKNENVATFYVSGKNSSSTVVYDYTHSLICARVNSKVCYLTKMDKTKIPSLDSISSGLQNTQTTSNTGAPVTTDSNYGVQKEPVGVRSGLGTTINVLCSNIPMYWAQQSDSQSRGYCVRYEYDYHCFMIENEVVCTRTSLCVEVD